MEEKEKLYCYGRPQNINENIQIVPFYLIEGKSPKRFYFVKNNKIFSERSLFDSPNLSKDKVRGYKIAQLVRTRHGRITRIVLIPIASIDEAKKKLIEYSKAYQKFEIFRGNFFWEEFEKDFQLLEKKIKNPTTPDKK